MGEKTWKNTTAKKQSEYSKKHLLKNKSLGICVGCKKNNLEPNSNKTMCPECRDNYRIYQQKTRDKNTSMCLCKWCGKLEKIEGITSCYVCVLKYISLKYFNTNSKWIDLLNLFKKQKGICPYTGDKLIIGINASLDHIIARSKGGLVNDISNMQWVRRDINDMKGTLSHDEFILTCKKIVDYNQGKVKNNNQWSELELSTLTYKVPIKKRESLKGKNHGGSKLTDKDVLEIRKLFSSNKNKYSVIFLSKKFNISISNVRSIIRRKLWKHI